MKRLATIFYLILIVTLLIGFFYPSLAGGDPYEVRPAPDLTAVDENGVEFSLSDYEGNVVILHFTGLESPLCIECLNEMRGQIIELEKLAKSEDNVSIITVNIRKNPYSVSGKDMAERDFDVNVSWHWVEDFNPFPIANLYQEYWTVDGAFSNPALVLVDENQSVVGVYHIYCIGRGKLDGVQTAESLAQDVQDISEGNWEGFKGEIYDDSITFIFIFTLGILTALSPCSIALLVAMISYVGSLQKKDSENKSKKFSLQGLWIGIFFTIGMSIVFFIFGLIISSVGIFIEASTLFYLITGVILIILGINVFKPIKELLKTKKQKESGSQVMAKGQKIFFKISKKSIYMGVFFLGILFSTGWAPCAMTLMMPVFVLTITQNVSLLMGGLLLFVFGLGHGVPIIPLCAVTSSVRGKVGNKYVSAGKWMQRIFGVIIIVIGVIMAVRFWDINLW